MAVALLNNVATTDAYSDALTVVFSFARRAFSVQVFNAAVYYQLGIANPAGRDIDWEPGEHFLAPSTASFGEAVLEGFPPGSMYAAIRLRSAAAGTPGRVAVI